MYPNIVRSDEYMDITTQERVQVLLLNQKKRNENITRFLCWILVFCKHYYPPHVQLSPENYKRLGLQNTDIF